MVRSISILEHDLVPKFKILSQEERKQVLERFKITENKLPKVLESDPVVKKLNAKSGDVLEIVRSSDVSGESIYYRVVVKG
ncbi:MAG: DNA-directed RNA polymerase subunit H [Candidatus Aenigmarchaeota archaeon]|nr:DNA-directed RNA polymerase subunit H [Candidatus Aenigmarchaeota archaeon]NIQ17300.1 DNA-directed RNA polymerase subunit H [Candidatus Aenigmarchaeota archaeon]NIS73161.1 DNA-directed RNA polymerase subunit H [Candidatus Aenigmarchaeota archaeon]